MKTLTLFALIFSCCMSNGDRRLAPGGKDAAVFVKSSSEACLITVSESCNVWCAESMKDTKVTMTCRP